MASLSLGTSVTPGSDASTSDYIAGVTITAGQVVIIDENDGKRLKLATTASAALAKAIGIALNGAAANQPVKVITRGTLENCATMVVGEAYFVSDTGGQVYPSPDYLTGDFGCFLGFAQTATKLKLDPFSIGVAHA